MPKKKTKQQRSPVQRFLALSDKQRDEEVAQFDREVSLSETRSMTAAERKRWRSIQQAMKAKARGRGRPVVGRGAERLTITIERDLRKQADAYARQHKMRRSEMIAAGLRLVMQHDDVRPAKAG